MKKNRPAYILNVIIDEEDLEKISYIIFKNSTSLGMRIYKLDRITMDRHIEEEDTEYGKVRFKYAKYKDIEKKSIEYDDLVKISKDTNLSIRKIYEELI